MAQALYSKYRPKTFDDVIGQESILKTLQNAIKANKVSHAYMFCGPRGTGKTTMARLLAKACMCNLCKDQKPITNFCGKCQNCEDISKGMHPDVYELDAASRTGVENVRDEIISRVGFAATRGNKKIYIIDEVHMLSTAAFNALLKTLEEPPEHVIFILCTTDPEKVPETILSRCQRFDFSAISIQDVVKRLKYVCEQEKVEADDEALDAIAQNCNGAMRNALTQLEQLIAFSDGKITLDIISQVNSQDQDLDYSQLIENLGMRDLPAVFEWIDNACQKGADFNHIYVKLGQIIRDMYLSCCGSKQNFANQEIIDEQLDLYSADRLQHIMTLLSELANQMKFSTNLRLTFELAMANISNPKGDLTLESLAERVANLEIVATAGDLSPAFTVENIQSGNAKKPKPEHMKPAGFHKSQENKPQDNEPEENETAAPETNNSNDSQEDGESQNNQESKNTNVHANPLDDALKNSQNSQSGNKENQTTQTEKPKNYGEDFHTSPNQPFEAGTVSETEPDIVDAKSSNLASAELTNPNLKIPEKPKPTNFAEEKEKIRKKVVVKQGKSETQESEPSKDKDIDIQKSWQQIYSNIRKKFPAFGATLLTADASFDKSSNQLILKFPGKDSFSVGVLKKPDSMHMIHEEVKAVLGPDVGFNIELDLNTQEGFTPAFVNNFREDPPESLSQNDKFSSQQTSAIPPATPDQHVQDSSPSQPESKIPEIPDFSQVDNLPEPPDLSNPLSSNDNSGYRPSQDLNSITDILSNNGAYNITEE